VTEEDSQRMVLCQEICPAETVEGYYSLLSALASCSDLRGGGRPHSSSFWAFNSLPGVLNYILLLVHAV
jgi:hypothetical protein